MSYFLDYQRLILFNMNDVENVIKPNISKIACILQEGIISVICEDNISIEYALKICEVNECEGVLLLDNSRNLVIIKIYKNKITYIYEYVSLSMPGAINKYDINEFITKKIFNCIDSKTKSFIDVLRDEKYNNDSWWAMNCIYQLLGFDRDICFIDPFVMNEFNDDLIFQMGEFYPIDEKIIKDHINAFLIY